MNSSQSQIQRKFEEMRQSIEVRNSMKIDRKSLVNTSISHKGVAVETIEDGDRQPHRNRDVTLTYQGDEDHAINVQMEDLTDANELEPYENNKKGDSDDHSVPFKTLIKRYNSNLQKGLTTQQAEEGLHKYGLNKLQEKKKTPAWIKFLHEITNGFAIMMWVGMTLCWIAFGIDPGDPSNYYLAIIIIFVVLLTGTITFRQNQSSEALMESFKNILPQKCRVVRNGTEQEIEALHVTIGDIVKVKAGEKIPADIRIIMSDEMKVDNSALTGESEPQLRVIECTHPNNVLETGNVAFFGTLCKEGLGEGIVIKIGDSTTLGQIADQASTEKKEKSPLRYELDRFVIMIAVIAITLGIIFFLLAALVAEYPVFFCVLLGIGILVANVPEGLLGCVTISLAVTARQLHTKNVLVKNLESVETLGSTSCICSDKTGTLTQNVMTVHNMWYNNSIVRTLNKLEVQNGKNLDYDQEETGFKELHKSAMIASAAKFDRTNEKDQKQIDYMTCKVLGDATETGMVRFFQQIEDIEKTRNRFKIPTNSKGQQAVMLFNSSYKFALTIVEEKTADSDYCIYMKGAPEKMWTYCQSISIKGEKKPKTKEWSTEFDRVNLYFGKQGERVLGFASYHLPRVQFPQGFEFFTSNPEKFNFPIDSFTFVGLISLIDPPKVTVPRAVIECRSAGIKVVMVTGDQPPTAAAIAKQVNIIPEGVETIEDLIERKKISWEQAAEECEAIVVHGDRITEANRKDKAVAEENAIKNGRDINKIKRTECNITLRKWVKKPYCVFARTTPAQKLLIVQACQDEGFICAATGDGVNDSPAIKQADIGISMNLSGSEVTKDAADMILLNDDFSSIVNGVEEGRKIFDNLKKTIIYVLASNIPELMPFLAFIAVRIPLPITNIFMIFIDVGTDILPAISLGYEQAEIDVMTRRPRTKTEHLVSLKVINHAYALMGIFACGGGFNAYYTTMNHFGFPVRSLFGLSTIKGYKVNENQFNHLNKHEGGDNILGPRVISKDSVFYNENIMMTDNTIGWGNCDKQIAHFKAQLGDKYGDLYDKVEWIEVDQGKVDLRKSLVYCDDTAEDENERYWRPLISWSYCDVNLELNHSPMTDTNACYTAEALKYGQTSWTFGIVIFQMSNIILLKSRKTSFTTTPVNKVMLSGLLLEIVLVILIAECPGIQNVFGGRPLSFWQFAIPAAPWSVTIMMWEESRKFLIRNVRWFEKYAFW